MQRRSRLGEGENKQIVPRKKKKGKFPPPPLEYIYEYESRRRVKTFVFLYLCFVFLCLLVGESIRDPHVENYSARGVYAGGCSLW